MDPILVRVLLVVFISVGILSGCDLNKWDLEVIDNEYIPNYSITLNTIPVDPTMHTDIIALNDSRFILALEDTSSAISIVEVFQTFDEDADQWELNASTIVNIDQGDLSFFDVMNESFMIGYTNLAGKFVTKVLDLDFTVISESFGWEGFIDTSYNTVDKLQFLSFDYVVASKEILFVGTAFSQGTSYSCLLNVDKELNPLWFKTYFEKSSITDVVSLNQDTFILLNSNEFGTDLIRDNANGNAYTKYNISSDDLFFGSQSIFDSSIVYICGINDGVGRIIEVDLDSEIAFVNDIEIYFVHDIRALFLSRDSIITSGIQEIDSEFYQFSSELNEQGSKWCKRDVIVGIHKILDLIEMPGKGILITTIIERGGNHYLHLIRIDEEGAQFNNSYTENCL